MNDTPQFHVLLPVNVIQGGGGVGLQREDGQFLSFGSDGKFVWRPSLQGDETCRPNANATGYKFTNVFAGRKDALVLTTKVDDQVFLLM